MKIAVLLIALGAGACTRVVTYGSGAAAGHPPALPAGAVVPMWDHFCGQPSGQPEALIALLDEASANGWEMVSYVLGGAAASTNFACFKRPRMTAPPTAEPSRTAPAAPSS